LEKRKQRLREACGDRLYEELVRRNAMDLELVERARVEVDRRFSRSSSRYAGFQ